MGILFSWNGWANLPLFLLSIWCKMMSYTVHLVLLLVCCSFLPLGTIALWQNLFVLQVQYSNYIWLMCFLAKKFFTMQ